VLLVGCRMSWRRSWCRSRRCRTSQTPSGAPTRGRSCSFRRRHRRQQRRGSHVGSPWILLDLLRICYMLRRRGEGISGDLGLERGSDATSAAGGGGAWRRRQIRIPGGRRGPRVSVIGSQVFIYWIGTAGWGGLSPSLHFSTVLNP
jgi:hypothetical protein